jgi:eukaryotic-like serine/threonine-protein kinase
MSKDVKAVPTRWSAVPSVEPDNRAPVGLRVKGRYRVMSELGTGVFGTVCLAVDETDGHEIAIRFLPRELVDLSRPRPTNRRADQSPAHQSIVDASTAHPSLVRVREFGQAETGQAFAAMELVQGRRLSALLSEGNLDVTTALRIAIDLGEAVETLHNRGLVHGALRPGNVMIGRDGRVTLMDVELTGVRAAQAVHGIMVDEPPPEYLSPEQIRQVRVTETTDIYAFAVILYEILCGVPPFQGETREAVLTKHLTEIPIPMRQRRRTVPVAVEAVVALALSKEPEPRPPIQTILNRLWEEANRSKTRWKRVHVIIAGGVLATSTAAVVGWSLLTPRLSAPPPLVRPTPPAVVEQAPIPAASATSSPSPIEPRTEPSPEKATPAVVPSLGARPTPPTVRSPTSPPRRVERLEQRRTPQTPANAANERPAASSGTDDPDPSAIIDWILEQRAAARRGQ